MEPSYLLGTGTLQVYGVHCTLYGVHCMRVCLPIVHSTHVTYTCVTCRMLYNVQCTMYSWHISYVES